MAAEVAIEITKTFPARACISAELKYELQQATALVLFGPSGSGKTTVLRSIAGLEWPERGRIRFISRTWLDTAAGIRVAPQDRQIGYMAQDYALFPTHTVAGNIAYGLSALTAAERNRRVDEMVELFQLRGLETSKPRELSGGQQQRVAVARALVLQPKILLLDEPLSNLDAKLRHQLRQQLKDLQNEFGITTVYVTHDQDEALAMSDRVAVFNKGMVEQVGTPQTIYDHSATEFVCNFIGDSSALTPEFVGELNRQSRIRLDPGARSYLRVEKASLAPATGGESDGAVAVGGTVVSRTYHGLHSRYRVTSHGSELSIIVREDGSRRPEPGAGVTVHVRPEHVLQYHPESGSRLEDPALATSATSQP